MTTAAARTLEEVRAAAVAIEPYLSLPTPLLQSPVLSELLGTEISLRLELATPIGAFKLRGGLNLFGQLSDGERAAGLVTASTGNHGQSVSYSAQLHEARAVIFVPERANVDKIAAMELMGAEVRSEGDRFDDCIRLAHSFADANGIRFVSSGDDPALITGVWTATLESQPDTDVVIVPVGGGSGVSIWCVVRDDRGSQSKIWGVQAAQVPAAYESWREGSVVTRPNLTMAEGLATGADFELPLSIVRGSLDEFLLVDGTVICDAVVTMLEHQHLLLEPAGASALAAALGNRERFAGCKVVLVCSGAHVTRVPLQALLDSR